MARRGNEMGMDFEYDNRTGPMDSRSPFSQVAHNQQRFPQQNQSFMNKKRYDSFDSPRKSQTPGRFPSPDKPLPQTPAAFNALFTTPRKPSNNIDIDIDDSSAGETPRSPERDDSNAPTPESTNKMGIRNNTMKQLSQWRQGGMSTQSQAGAEQDSPMELDEDKVNVKERNGGRPSPKKRESIMVMAKEMLRGKSSKSSSKSGKGALKRRDRDGITKSKPRKKRHSMSDSEDIDGGRKTSGSKQRFLEGNVKEPHWLSNLFTFIGAHPTVPHILSFYAQLAFNVFLLSALAYLIYCFYAAVQGDIDKKAFEAMAEVMAESAQCLHEWNINKCDRSTRIPAIEVMCENLQQCMNRDATKVGRAKVSAHTFAEIFNSFVEPISWKAMIFTAFIVFGGFATTNVAFSFFRQRHQHEAPPQYFPPPTPQRSFSGQPGEGYYGTPWQHQQIGLEPQPSPTRRIGYN